RLSRTGTIPKPVAKIPHQELQSGQNLDFLMKLYLVSHKLIGRADTTMETGIYRFGGLRIASDFPLFGLHVCRNDSGARCDVVIRCGPIPEGVASVAAKFHSGGYSGTYNGREILLDYPVGRFLLRAGEEILIDLAPSSDDDNVRGHLLGAVFGALCHQRG